MILYKLFFRHKIKNKKKADFPKVMSLKDGSKKMSKSDTNDNSRINLIDSPEVIFDKIK